MLGKIIGGKIIPGEDVPFPEGAVVKIELLDAGDELDDEDSDLSPEDLPELEDRAAAAERGEVVTSTKLFDRLKRIR